MRRKDREVTALSEIEKIIEEADVCRVAFVDDDVPYIVAMNFGYHQGEPSVLYFHCASKGKKLDLIEKNNKVCFQMDIHEQVLPAELACDFSINYKSVVGFGTIMKVVNEREKLIALNSIMKHYTGKESFEYDPDLLRVTTVLRLNIYEMTGKKKGN